MIHIIQIDEGKLKVKDRFSSDEKLQTVWLDIADPNEEELKWFEVNFPAQNVIIQQSLALETPVYFYEGTHHLEFKSVFINRNQSVFYPESICFLIQNKTLITYRKQDFPSISNTLQRIKNSDIENFDEGIEILISIFEFKIDADTSALRYISGKTTEISKSIINQEIPNEKTLISITGLQENTIVVRESLTDILFIVSTLLKSEKTSIKDKNLIQLISQDIKNILENTAFTFERLEYLQDSLLGIINLRQNQVIKIFTVVTVVCTPPILIAGIYGMNFQFMPELSWKYGYVSALLFMLLSSIITLYIFRKKRWL